MSRLRFFLAAVLLIAATAALAQTARFRTDADGPIDPKKAGGKEKGQNAGPAWFQLVPGEFPPEGSAHAVSGELISINHLERRFQLRVDRNDTQDRGVWDLPLHGALLPYGSIYYRGAPAALQDIPLGTHLHGLFYLKDPADKTPLPHGPANNRQTPESEFRRCFRLEDDFSYHARQKQSWKIESVDLEALKLTATLQESGQPSGPPKIFDLLTSTRVLQGRAFADLKTLVPGQLVLFNLTWVTLYGPGRITEIFLDEPSRALATSQQLEQHRNHVRERGLPGWVTAVDDVAETVTITFFGSVEEKLFEELKLPPLVKPGAPPADPAELRASIAVARESLMTYDPVNDRKGGVILAINRIPVEPGSSGVQIRVKCDMLLEGYRPRRIVRVYPGAWKVNALPREEQFFGWD